MRSNMAETVPRNAIKTVLLAGGAGYIASHCALVLLEKGYDVVAIDNFCNSYGSPDGKRSLALERVEKLTGKTVDFYNADLRDAEKIDAVFKAHKIDAVINFAAFKNVTASAYDPLRYFDNNLKGTINLLMAMKTHKVYNLVFSGSCTVYGHPETLPVTEADATGNVKNPYGRTKYFCEEIMKDVCTAHPEFNMISLRYFNPIGAHPSGEIGEDAVFTNVNIIPFLAEVAIGREKQFTIFGDDYDTRDGTCVRDYTHVMDLAAGHELALEKLAKEQAGFRAYNLGIGRGFTVKEMISAFEEASGVKINVVVSERRPFNIDAPKIHADPSRAMAELGYRPKCYDHVQMCRDFWTWKQKNPNGYRQTQMNFNNCPSTNV